MEMVIKISEKNREKIKHAKQGIFIDLYGIMETAINNGTPLPKGHGDLIDRGKLSICPIDTTDLPQDKCLMVYLADDVNNAETIIGADKESEQR